MGQMLSENAGEGFTVEVWHLGRKKRGKRAF